jgi:hypothetical protein
MKVFFWITQYVGDTHNARTPIPMNTRTQTLPLGASSKTVPANPQYWWSHHRRLAVDGNESTHVAFTFPSSTTLKLFII